MTIIRKAHKWIALILGIQLVLWMISGLGMAILPHDRVVGEHHRSVSAGPVPLLDLSDGQTRGPAVVSGAEVSQIRLHNLNSRAVFETVMQDGSVLTDAVTGEIVTVDEKLAREIALNDYSGPGQIVKARLLTENTLEFRNHQTQAWRIDFSDSDHTTIYVSAENGKILERRNNYWRVFDVFWMLHIMDYQDRSSFNHPLIIISALIVVWLGFSGIALWWDSFRRSDFAIIRKWKIRNKTFALSLTDSEGGPVRTVRARPMQSLFAAMADEGYPLPSTCGGGGTCGLCRVKIGTDLPVLPADRRQIPQTELDDGYRLACQHRVEAPLAVSLPHGLLDAKELVGKVVSSTFITPDMYELRLSLPGPLDFRAGSYIQVEVPPYQAHLDEVDLPASVKANWEASGSARTVGCDEPVHRTYSLANAPGELGKDVILSIRLALAQAGSDSAPAGVGSAYLASLTTGDTVQLRGPFGDFHVEEDAAELVFIGGGAGIAPIRSMIIDELATQTRARTITFWYGARTREHIVYEEDFERLANDHSNFSWYVALSDVSEADGWPGSRGLIHEIFRDQYLASHPDIASCRFYICGPPAMLEAVLSLLASLGVPKDRIAFDDFGN